MSTLIQSSMDGVLAEALLLREQQNRYRKIRCAESAQTVERMIDGKQYLSFCSNDYLGLANHPRVVQAFQQAAERYGVGSGASHLVSGHTAEHEALEQELAAFTGRESALVFSSGYMANMGVINALLGRKDTVFQDRLNHASLIDGALLSDAKFIRYRHNDVEHLEHQLNKCSSDKKLIVSDGVFSMDGDVAPLTEISVVAKKYNAWLMVDDAHGFGCLGETGGGSIEHFNLSVDDVPVLVGTFGKAFGTFGAFVAGSKTLTEYLIQFSRNFVFTTAIPAAVAAATRESLKLISEEKWRREKLKTLIQQFRSGAESLGLELLPSSSPIQPIIFGEDIKANKASQYLDSKGIWVSAIRPPTVPEGTARLRVTFTADHSEEQVNRLLDVLGELAHES